jgi:hypothetical protein
MTRIDRALWTTGLILVFLAAFLLAAFPVRGGNDEWWHIKTGWYQYTHHDLLPEYEVFTYTGEKTRWANHEWLSDYLIYVGFRFLGLPWLNAVKAAWIGIVFVLLAWLALRRSRNLHFALFFALLAAISSRYSMHLRPPIFTYMGIVVMLHVLINVEERLNRARIPVKEFILLFVLGVVWINLHGGGIIAIVIPALFSVGFLLEWAWRRFIRADETGEGRPGRKAGWFAALTVLMGIATLCNPYGYDIHLLTWKVMRDPVLVQYIFELQTPNFHHTKGFEVMILILFILGAFGAKRLRFPDLLLVLFFFQQAVNHVRHLPLFSIVVAPILAWLSVGVLDRYVTRPAWQGYVRNGFLVLAGLICSVLIPLEGVRYADQIRNNPLGYIRSEYPSEAVDFILENDFHGRMYNEINYSGYLIYRLSPQPFKVFTDARFDIYGSQFMKQSHAIMDAMSTPPGPPRLTVEQYARANDWDRALLEYWGEAARMPPGADLPDYWRWLLDRWDVNFLLLFRGSRLFAALHNGDSEWKEVYTDGAYAIYVRNVPENGDLIRRTLGR